MNPNALPIHRDASIAGGRFSGDCSPRRRPNPDAFLHHVDHVSGLIGPEHLAAGTDLAAVRDLDAIAPITRMTLESSPGTIGEYARAFGNHIRTRHPEDCSSHVELVRRRGALLDRGGGEIALRGFLRANLPRALDLARAR